MRLSTAMRVQKHRKALRASGLRPIQIWVPDTRRASFEKECKRQSMLIINDKNEKEIIEWISNISDKSGWV